MKLRAAIEWACVLPAWRMCLLGTVAAMLVACSPRPRVEVVERSVLTVQAETEKIGGSIVRIVQPGDTLHGIAFGLGLNVNELAGWNAMDDTSKLIAGKQLRLTRPPNYSPPPKEIKPKSTVSSTSRVATSASTSSKTPTPAAPAVSTRDNRPASKVKPNYASKPRWSWPVRGKVIGQFSLSNGRQGIDILGREGSPVIAASAGEVVYVGNSLKGYGNLIIIKHNERYLSAYAHNQKIFVKEGQTLSARQSIGAVGKNRSGQTALHFQIRKDGKPLNPMAFLPAG